MSDRHSMKVHRDPPTLDPDPLAVEPEPVDDRPLISFRGCAWIAILAALIVFWVMVALLAVVTLATPRSAQITAPGDVSRLPSTERTGAPHSPGVAQLAERGSTRLAGRSEVPGSSPGPGGAGGAPLPASRSVTTARPNPMPAPLRGWATWYRDPRHPGGLYAAAGPALRRMLGPAWRGSVVIVEGPGRASVRVTLTDACWCIPRHNEPTLLDLSADAFERLAPLGWGVVSVSVESLAGPAVTLPPTDAELAGPDGVVTEPTRDEWRAALQTEVQP